MSIPQARQAGGVSGVPHVLVPQARQAGAVAVLLTVSCRRRIRRMAVMAARTSVVMGERDVSEDHQERTGLTGDQRGEDHRERKTPTGDQISEDHQERTTPTNGQISDHHQARRRRPGEEGVTTACS